MKRVAVYLRDGKLYIHTCSKTTTGLFIDDYTHGIHVHELDDSEGINRSILKSLENSGEGLPHPEWSTPISEDMKPLLSAARVKSYRTFTAGAKHVSVNWDGDVLRIRASRNKGPGKGFGYFPEGKFEFPFSPDFNFYEKLMEAFDLCE